MPAQVKICGVTRAEDVRAAVYAGVAYLGLNFFSKSPRYLDITQASALSAQIPRSVIRVGLVVNAEDSVFDALSEAGVLDMLQLHGAETPERVAEVKARTGLPVMKVIGVSQSEDLAKIQSYAHVADMLLVDAKPPKGAVLPGGNGLTFDWRLLDGVTWPLPWMLAGGLTPDNATEAARRTGAPVLDVASGVEAAPGVKDASKMRAFIERAAAA
jgi:phosphoribosylanthranilate isomerase